MPLPRFNRCALPLALSGLALLGAATAPPAAAATARPAAPAAEAPAATGLGDAARWLLGTWQWSRREDGCTETYEFRADGSGATRSRDERAEVRWRVAAEAMPSGVYPLQVQITRDSGGADCAELAEDDSGKTYTVFLRFSPLRDAHLVCFEDDEQRCFGPLRKLVPAAAGR